MCVCVCVGANVCICLHPVSLRAWLLHFVFVHTLSPSLAPLSFPLLLSPLSWFHGLLSNSTNMHARDEASFAPHPSITLSKLACSLLSVSNFLRSEISAPRVFSNLATTCQQKSVHNTIECFFSLSFEWCGVPKLRECMGPSIWEAALLEKIERKMPQIKMGDVCMQSEQPVQGTEALGHASVQTST